MPTIPSRRRAALMLVLLVGLGACGDDAADQPQPEATEAPLAKQLRERAEGSKAPPAIKEVMQRAQRELQASDLAAQALGVGDEAPAATFLSGTDDEFTLAGLRANGPVVLAFYRGKW